MAKGGRRFTHIDIVIQIQPTMPIRHNNSTFYDGTVGRNNYPLGFNILFYSLTH
jgi:hypothetical protein